MKYYLRLIQMQEFGGYGVSLLVALLAVLSSGREIASKYACLGDSTALFKDITFEIGLEEVTLYRNGHWSSVIATWFKRNDTMTSAIVPEYTQRVFLDEYGSIWLRNIQVSDEAKYSLSHVIYSSLMKNEMHLHVLVPPNNDCRPNIMHVDNMLTVYLDSVHCGSPIPNVRWLDHPGISHASNTFAELRPGKEAGTYYACSEGPALRCLKTSTALDFCSPFTITGFNGPPESLEIPELMTITTLLVAIIVQITVIAIIAAIMTAVLVNRCKRHVQKYQAESTLGLSLKKHMKRPGNFKEVLNVSPACASICLSNHSLYQHDIL